jgi:hypothetical protein
MNDPSKTRQWDTPEIAECMRKMNEEFFAVLNYGNKFLICSEEQDRLFPDSDVKILTAQKPTDFYHGLSNEFVRVGEKQNGEPKFKTAAEVWLQDPDRRQYEKVIFAPNQDLGPRYYNLWRGFPFTPQPGDCSLYLAHVKENICSNDPVKYDYLIKWMAYAVRNPHQQGYVAIVIQGLKGVGKNIFAEAFAKLFGSHGIVLSDSARVLGHFNAHLRDKSVLIADEAFFAGSRRDERILKDLITGNTLSIEAKGVDVVTVRNLLHILILGNDSWLVPTTWDERRYLVLRCSDAHRGEQQYFGAILEQLKNGGYAALLHHLMHEVDLSNFNVRKAPHTVELHEQTAESLRGIEATWHEFLYHGSLPAIIDKSGQAWLKIEDFIRAAKDGGTRAWDLKPQHVQDFLGEARPGRQQGMSFTATRTPTEVSHFRFRAWCIPPLKEARDRWDARRNKVEWPEIGDLWEDSRVK